MNFEQKILLELIKLRKPGDIISKNDVLSYFNSLSNGDNISESEFNNKLERAFLSHFRGLSRFILTRINLDNITSPETILQPENIQHYKKMFQESNWSPPIIYDPKNLLILDGRHRIRALQELRAKDILAFIPLD